MLEKKPIEAETDKQPQRDNAALLSRLKPEEYDVYIWLLQSYSVRWISETLGLTNMKVRKLAAGVYKTLKVNNQRELIHNFVSVNKYEKKPQLSGEDFAYAMASYTNQCITRAALQ